MPSQTAIESMRRHVLALASMVAGMQPGEARDRQLDRLDEARRELAILEGRSSSE